MKPVAAVMWRTVPWVPVAGLAAGAALFFGSAIMLRHNGFAVLLAVLALGAGAAAAAFLLDEPALEVADATPASRGRRAVWRVALAPLLAALLGLGLLVLDRLDPATHWSRLWVVAAAGVLVGVGIASVIKHSGRAAPGESAAVLALAAVALVALANPLQHWVSGLPLGSGPLASRGVTMWVMLGLLGLVAVVALERDPFRVGR